MIEEAAPGDPVDEAIVRDTQIACSNASRGYICRELEQMLRLSVEDRADLGEMIDIDSGWLPLVAWEVTNDDSLVAIWELCDGPC